MAGTSTFLHSPPDVTTVTHLGYNATTTITLAGVPANATWATVQMELTILQPGTGSFTVELTDLNNNLYVENQVGWNAVGGLFCLHGVVAVSNSQIKVQLLGMGTPGPITGRFYVGTHGEPV